MVPNPGSSSDAEQRAVCQGWEIEDMGHATFKGSEPFDLIAQRLTSAAAEGEIVAARVPVFASGFPANEVQIRILLDPRQAEDLARQLMLEAEKARNSKI